MLRVRNSELKLTTQGYHFDENGRKFIRIWTSLNFIKIKIKIERHKEMHIKSITTNFPYTITNNWVEITTPYSEIDDKGWLGVENYIDKRCKEVWFV